MSNNNLELEFSPREKELYNKLESKRKRIEQNTKKMYKWADDHKEELLERWNLELREDVPEPSTETEPCETNEDYQIDFDNFGGFV